MPEFNPELAALAQTASLRLVPSTSTWTGHTGPRERKPIVQRLPWSPAYGPHICPACYGAGWMRDTKDTGRLEQCVTCNTVDQQQINRQLTMCWDIGKIKPDTPNPLGFDTFPQTDAAAAASLRAAYEFARLAQGFFTLHGTYGGGKSGLGEAVTRSLLHRRRPCLFINASNLFEYLGAVQRTDTDDTDYAGRMTWCVSLSVLVIDELNMEGNSKAVADLRRSLIDARYRRALDGERSATMLISNTTPDNWHDQAVASRAQDSRFTCLESTTVDFRRIKR